MTKDRAATEANARLIAAAPQMVEALRVARDTLLRTTYDSQAHWKTRVACEEAAATTRAALQTATGDE